MGAGRLRLLPLRVVGVEGSLLPPLARDGVEVLAVEWGVRRELPPWDPTGAIGG